MKRRMLSFALVLMLALSLLPLGASAADIVDSGRCGQNVTWTLDSAGNLVISGTGLMYNYYNFQEAKHAVLLDYCDERVFEYGESIGDEFEYFPSPFYNRTSIKTVTINDGVNDIGNMVFHNCTGLTSVTIPSSVRVIGDYAFSGCTGLTNVSIPSSVTWIGDNAFSVCTGLTSVTIPEGVTNIGSSAFFKCSGLTSVTIPSTVKSIGDNAFYGCTGLPSVTIPQSVTSIGKGAYSGCASLTSIEVADGNSNYISSEGVLFNKGKTVLIQYPEGKAGAYKIPEGVTSIVFSNCTGLTSVTIPSSVTSLGQSVFYGCTGLTSVMIPSSVTSIGQAAFYGCTGLTSVTIPSSVTSIGNSSFFNCKGLTSVTIPSSVRVIGDYAFSGCTGLTSVTIQDGVTAFGNGAFRGCTSLTNITIPPSVTRLFDEAFSGCSSLASVTFTGNAPEIYSGCFKGVTATAYYPTNIPVNTSLWTSSAKRNYGGKITWKGYQLEGSTILFSGKCGDDLTWTINADKVLAISGTGEMWDFTSKIIPWNDNNNVIESVLVSNGVTSIGSRAFCNCRNLKSVTIPDSVERISDDAFSGCGKLKSIVIPDSVASIGDHAFSDCSGLTSVTIPDSVSGIGEEAFCNCGSLTSVTIPDSVVNVGKGVFKDCVGMQSATVSGSLGEYAFQNCTGLEQLIMNGGNEISAYALGGCTALKKIYLPATLTIVAANAFRNDDALTDVFYDGTQEQWGSVTIRTAGNDPLLRATLHWNSTAPTPTPAPTPEPTGKNPFKDVKKDAYYYEPVLWAVNHDPQITNGTGPDTFSPDATCTRGQVVTFLWRAAGCPEPTSTKNPFKDVSKDAYYYKAVLWAVEQGITNGTGKDTFSPNAGCTRGQVVTFQYRANGSPKVSAKNPFKDVSKDAYYYDAVLWAVKNAITNGTSATTFSPNNTCTRGQIVTFLYRDMR